jgi:hypothetical protein
MQLFSLRFPVSISFVTILFSLFSCSENTNSSQNNSEIQEVDSLIEPDQKANERVWEKGILAEDQEQAWYIPTGLQAKDSVVCILFFDPQGDGKKPLGLYKQLAEKHKIILVGSKKSKNGMGLDEAKAIAAQLLREVNSGSGFKRIAFYVAGFSGGAKVALHAANGLSELKGVLYSGAASLSSTPRKPMFGFAGNMDMNLADLVQFDASLPTEVPHFLKFWNGKHEWPVAEVFNSGLEWIKIKENVGFGALEKRRTDLQFKARRTNNLLEKEALLLEAKFLGHELSRKDLDNSDLDILRTRPAFVAAKTALNQELTDELALKDFYSPAFFDKDINWWGKEISELKAHKKHKSGNLQDRVLGFFSLASYSLANKALQEQDEKLASKILEIYQLSDPQNNEQAYLRAVLAARMGQDIPVFESLREAKTLGFKDKPRILQQLEFQKFADNLNFKKILEGM